MHCRRFQRLAPTPPGATGWMHPTLSDDPIPGGSVHVIGIGRVAWSRVIPFRIDPANRVVPINRVEWQSPSGEGRTITLRDVMASDNQTYRFETERQ